VGAVVAGFVTIVSIIALGVLLAQLGILDVAGQEVLTRLTFYVAGPALIVTVLAGTDVSRLFSANLVASISGVAVSVGCYVCLVRLRSRRSVGDTVIGAFSASYVNAAKAMSHEVSWPLFGVLALWILGGLLLYCLASELVGAMGPARVKALLFSPHSSSAER